MWTVNIGNNISDGNGNSPKNWIRVCYILAKSLSAFSLCCETLWEAEFKDDRLIHLME
jgi:hypothetical protein